MKYQKSASDEYLSKSRKEVKKGRVIGVDLSVRMIRVARKS